MTFKLGPASRSKLIGVHPDLVRVVERAITLTTVDFRVLCGVRTVAEQRVLVRNGKSKTMKSRHLTGHAVDIVPLPVDWENLGPFRSVAIAMKGAAADLNIPLTWGGSWQSFPDFPHWELPRDRYPA